MCKTSKNWCSGYEPSFGFCLFFCLFFCLAWKVFFETDRPPKFAQRLFCVLPIYVMKLEFLPLIVLKLRQFHYLVAYFVQKIRRNVEDVVVVVAHIYFPATGQLETLNIRRSVYFHCNDYFVVEGIHTCLGVSCDPKFLWISSNSYLLNLLIVRSHQAEKIIVKRLIQGRNKVTRVQVEPRSWDQGCHKQTLLPTQPRFRVKCSNPLA